VDVPKIAERAAKQAPRSCEEGAISWECHQRYSNMGIIYDNWFDNGSNMGIIYDNWFDNGASMGKNYDNAIENGTNMGIIYNN
jgi:predicted molibdopterin-dependent oxidoreductase YjgC